MAPGGPDTGAHGPCANARRTPRCGAASGRRESPSLSALSDLTQSTLGYLRSAGSYIGALTTPTVRLGVTGLSRAGKTVFITSLVRNLVTRGRLPFFGPAAEGRIVRAYLEPQPDDEVPRFAYEDHLATLARDPPEWPESTKRISELRVTLEYVPRSALRRQLRVSRLSVDIVDYPGEWLTDLGLMQQTYVEWSATALKAARDSRRSAAARGFLEFLAAHPAGQAADEQAAIQGARLFTEYLAGARNARASGAGDPTLGPGRFLLPGELAGSPLLTFFPLDLEVDGTGEEASAGAMAMPVRGGSGSLHQMMERRYQSYKSHVVLPFFRDHFARLDRQIVLVDALAALDQGPAAVADLEASLTAILATFRTGAQAWLPRLMPRRIDRILFAATKADHLHQTSHDRLESLLAELTRRAGERAQFTGAEVKAVAMAALRATREAEVTRSGEKLPVIVGTPLPGERIGSETFDGTKAAAVFPGDLPEDPRALLTGLAQVEGHLRAVRFRPVRIPPDDSSGAAAPWPHIRLDRALDFLIGDRLQ